MSVGVEVETPVLVDDDTGEDVAKLQEILIEIPDIYTTSTVSGFYGRLTEEAVIAFQSREGLKKTGAVDTDTRNKLYETITNLTTEDTSSIEFTPIDLSSVADLQNYSASTESSSTHSTESSSTHVSVADLQNQVTDLAFSASDTQTSIVNLQNQISQLFTEISNLQTDLAVMNVASALPPPPLLLAISNLQASNITKASSTITWTTNNQSTSEVDYSTSSTISAGQASVVNQSTYVTSHSLILINLHSGTKYYYRAVSKDNTGITASSSILSFTTPS